MKFGKQEEPTTKKTIDSYREHLKSKLGLSTGVQLARRATLWVEIGRTG